MKTRILRILLAVSLALGATGLVAGTALAATSCGYASDRAGWAIGYLSEAGSINGSGEVRMTAYFCWNGTDSWSDSAHATNPTYTSTASRIGGSSASVSLLKREKWASGSDTYFRITTRMKVVYDSSHYCYFDGYLTIVVNRNGVATGSVTGPTNLYKSQGVCSVNSWGRIF